MPNSRRRFLGIDPGFGRLGYGIVEKNGADILFVKTGCVETVKSMAQEQRLREIYDQISSLINRDAPDALAIEKLFFSTNAKTVMRVAETRGVMLLLAQMHQMPVFELTPLEVKMAVTGYGKADKKQVQHMVMRLLKLGEVPKPDDAADALAIAITAAHTLKLAE